MGQFQDDIVLTVLQAKDIAGQWAVQMIQKEQYGEDLGCCDTKLMYLVKLIRSMESYYATQFNANGYITSPSLPCLSLSQGEELLAKIKALIK